LSSQIIIESPDDLGHQLLVKTSFFQSFYFWINALLYFFDDFGSDCLLFEDSLSYRTAIIDVVLNFEVHYEPQRFIGENSPLFIGSEADSFPKIDGRNAKIVLKSPQLKE
jgi:hypothetical protein